MKALVGTPSVTFCTVTLGRCPVCSLSSLHDKAPRLSCMAAHSGAGLSCPQIKREFGSHSASLPKITPECMWKCSGNNSSIQMWGILGYGNIKILLFYQTCSHDSNVKRCCFLCCFCWLALLPFPKTTFRTQLCSQNFFLCSISRAVSPVVSFLISKGANKWW